MFTCPKCHRGKLFHGFLTIAPACGECGLPLAQHEQGDGPAVFAILIVGALVVIASTIVEMKYEPPLWVHALIWPVFIVVASLVSLRVLKAALIRMQYKYKKWDFEA